MPNPVGFCSAYSLATCFKYSDKINYTFSLGIFCSQHRSDYLPESLIGWQGPPSLLRYIATLAPALRAKLKIKNWKLNFSRLPLRSRGQNLVL